MAKKEEGKKGDKKPTKRQNGRGTIIDFGDRAHLRYGARVTVSRHGGRQQYKYIGRWETRTEAATFLDLYCVGQYTPALNVTFEHVYDEWKETHFKRISKQTEDNYKAAYLHLASLKNAKFANIRTAHMQSIVDALDRSHSTKTKVKALLTLLYKYAMQNDICTKNYAEFIRLDKESKEERKIFTEPQIRLLWRKKDIPYLDTVLILIYTGMRIQEMLNLTKFNIDIKNQVIVGGLKTDAGKDRSIPIHPKLRGIIEKYYNNATDALFTREDGRKITQDYYRRNIFNPIMERLKIEGLTPHATRHTFASLLAKKGADTNDIKNLIGHSDYSFTANVYTHTDVEKLRETIASI